MTRCEVLVNFDVKDWNVLKSKIDLNNVVFFTNDLSILEGVKQLGYNIKFVANYFGEFTRDGDAINDVTIKRLGLIELLNTGSPERASMINGLRYIIVQHLRNLERIKRILEEKKDVIFLFGSFSFHYFVIPEIAKTAGVESRYGISQISNSKLISVSFADRTHRFRLLQNKMEEEEEDGFDLDSYSTRLPDIQFNVRNPRYAFFLINNETDFYLKPVYPVLKKFNENSKETVIFTFDFRTTEQLIEKGFHAFNLSRYFRSLAIRKPRLNISQFIKILLWPDLNKRNKRRIRIIRRVLKRQVNLFKGKLLRLYFRHLYKYKILRNIISRPQIKLTLLKAFGQPDDILDLIDYVYDAPHRENGIVLDFFKSATELQTDDFVLKSYLRYFNDNYIVNYLLRLLVAHELVKSIIKKFGFSSIVVAADASPVNNVVCNIAASQNIPTYSFPQVFLKMTKIFPVFLSASKIVVSGQRVKNEFIRLGVNEDKIIVTGSSRYDYVSHNLRTKHEHGLKENSSKKLIIVAMSRWHENDDVWMSQLIQYCNRKDLDILIKIHPMYKFSTNNDYSEEMVKKIAKNCVGLNYTLSYDIDLTKFLPEAEILVTEYSIVAVEAAFNEIPIIIADFSNEKNSEYSLAYPNEGIALYATTIEKLFKAIEKILYDEETKNNMYETIKKFNYDFNYLHDGNASQRIFDLLINTESEKITVARET